jgi:flagella basal body P-ring formation protein FlgA
LLLHAVQQEIAVSGKINRAFYRYAATAVAMVLFKPLHAADDGYTDLNAIRTVAEQALRSAAGAAGAQLIINVSMPDARLRLTNCPAPLSATIAGDGQLRERTTVGVRCDAGARWVIYLSAALASEFPVLVAQHALARGAVPEPRDFDIVTRRLPGLSTSYISDVAQLAGQHLRRPLAQAEALTADALVTAAIVHRGQQLTLLAHTSGMDVRVTVVALTDGRPAELIRVQNPATQRIVEATVRSAQLVEISL